MLEEPITIVQGESEENQKIDSSRYLSFRSNKIPSDWSGGEGEGGGEERKIADDDVDNVDGRIDRRIRESGPIENRWNNVVDRG